MNNEQIGIDIILARNDLTKAKKDFDKLGNSVNSIMKGSNLGNINRVHDRIKKSNIELKQAKLNMERVNFESSKLGQYINKGKQEIAGFNGAALSTLFFGMEIKRVFGGALTAIFEGYKKIIPENSEFNKQTTQLSANWEYFKFQLANAMTTSPVFTMMIKGAIGILKGFQALPEPIKQFIGVTIAGLALLGTYLMATSIIRLGLAGIIDQFGGLTNLASKFSWGNIAKYGWMALAAAAIAGMYLAWGKFSDSSDYAKKKTSLLSDALLDTANSALDTLTDAFSINGVEIKNWSEFMVGLGASIQNVILFLGMMADMAIFMGRTIINILQMALAPFVETIEALINSYLAIKTKDWGGLKDALTGINILGNIKEQFNDVEDAAVTMWDNIDKKRQAFVDPIKAIEEYRLEQSKLGDEGSTTNNYYMIQNPDEMINVAPDYEKTKDYLGVNM